MASPPKPQRSKEEVEDIILRKIFQVTLTPPPPTTADPRVVYLEMTAAEILSEGKPLRLTRDLMESILIDGLMGNTTTFAAAEPPFQYLLGCYRRAHDESRKITTAMKDKSLKSDMEALAKQAKKLSVSYCRILLSNPDSFPGSASDPSNASPLLPLIFAEVGGSVDGFGGSSSSSSGGGVQCPPGFLDEFLRDSDFDSLDPILKGLYEELREIVLKVSALGNFQQPLRALRLNFSSIFFNLF